MLKNVERKPNQYFEYHTDDSGVVRRTAWVLCPRCNKDMPEIDYQQHAKQCAQLINPTVVNRASRNELPKPVSNRISVRAAIAKSPEQRTKSGTNVPSPSTPIATATMKKRCSCPDCGKRVKNLRDHQRDVHGIRYTINRDLIACPHCPSKVRADRLDAHIQKVHKIEAATSQNTHADLPSTRKKKRKIRQAGHSEQYLSDAFSQSFDEPFDGSKGWHRRRENGRFGSHPLFDDYGDESSA